MVLQLSIMKVVSALSEWHKKLFYGEVKSLIMYAGILFDSRSISEGLFANNVLMNGYVFDSAGYCIRNVGDVSGYERMYSEKKYKYRELFRRNRGVILHYPTSQSTTMNQSICNLAKPGNQPTSNFTTPDNAYKEVGKIANGSAVVYNEGGKCFVRMVLYQNEIRNCLLKTPYCIQVSKWVNFETNKSSQSKSNTHYLYKYLSDLE